MKSLTVKQQRFVDAYIETGNAAEAARRARTALKTLTGMMFGPDAVPMQTSVVFFKR